MYEPKNCIMMRKLYNPFSSLPGFYCFGCSPDNHHGLKMDFFEDGDAIVSTWEPSDYFVLTDEKAAAEMDYPGIEAFYKNE